MKVVQINAVYEKGSTGRIVKELSLELEERDVESLIISTSNCKNKNHVKVGSFLQNKIHAIFSRIFGYDSHYSSLSTKKIIRILEKFSPDVVHLHNLHANYVNLPVLLRFLANKNIATVITLHDCWFFTGKCTHYTQAKCYNWQKECGGCVQLKKDIPSLFFDKTSVLYNEKKKGFLEIPRLAVIGVSNWITEQAKLSFLGQAKIVKRVYNWIDYSVFYPRETKDSKKFTILCIGAGWNKNSYKMDRLLELANSISEDMEILLVGSVDKNIKLPLNVKSIGYVNSTDELAKLYSSANVYVHLSMEDTFGKVIAEALSCGTPAIVYDSTACPELIGDRCGYVVKDGDVNSIVEKIDEIKEKGKDYYSPYCVEFVKSNFDKNKLIDETIEIYKNICEN